MSRFFKILVLIACFSLFNGSVIASIQADFSVIDSVGCQPFLVNFTDQSTGNISYWHWDFGNGQVAVGQPNVGCTYLLAGTFTVTLTVSDGVDTAVISKTNHITVHPSPVPDFTYGSTSGCNPFTVTMNNASIANGSPIVSWEWDFDDATGLHAGTNMSHTYNQPGIFDVTLIVQNAAGCEAQKHESQLIEVFDPPEANFFTNDSVNVCSAPLTVTFQDQSVSSYGIVQYNWLIDGAVYSGSSATHTFLSNGHYAVQLEVVDSNGCADTLVHSNFVNIGPISATINAPSQACPNDPITLEGLALGANTFTWDFGPNYPNQSGFLQYHAYPAGGQYTVQLITSLNGLCADTVQHIVNVDTVVANFTSSPNFACEAPLQVNFTDQSVGNIASWEWHFGYPNNNNCFTCSPLISTNQNPSFLYTFPGVYNDTLFVTTVNGCTDSIVKVANEEIHVINTSFSLDVDAGCGPLTINATNLSTPFDSIGQVFWDYGDGSPIDTTFSPTHTFNNTGSYTVLLQVISVSGCTTSYSQNVNVGALQNADFTFDTNFVCASDTVAFLNLSSDTNLIDEYTWYFSDGQTQSSPNPMVQFLDTGWMDVTLVVANNGCEDSLTIPAAIYSSGPIVEVTTSFECDSINYIEFEVALKGSGSLFYDFGDSSGIDSSGLINFGHWYPAIDSSYNFLAMANDPISGCSYELESQINIEYYYPQITISDSTPCYGDNVWFSASSSINISPNVIWAIGSPNSYTLQGMSHTIQLNQVGQNTFYTAFEANNGCLDTIMTSLHVYQPTADFDVDTTWGCAPFLASFTDLSLSDTNISNWDWDFGDFTNSNLQHPSHSYTGTGLNTYHVELTVTDTFGCTSDIKKYNFITTQQPESRFLISNPHACIGDSIEFYAVPSGNYSYEWWFSDSTSDSVQYPKKVFDSLGVYGAYLTLTDVQGCQHTYGVSNHIDIQSYPTANFTANPLESDCYPHLVSFNDSSFSDFPITWVWNFGDASNWVQNNQPFAQNLYNYPGLYDVTMVAVTSYGCADSITFSHLIDVGGPVAEINHDPLIACLGEEVKFWLDTANLDAQRFVWDFGGGHIDSNFTEIDTTTFVFADTGWNQVVLLYSDTAQKCNKIDTTQVYVHKVTADLHVEISDNCTPVSVFGQDESDRNTSAFWYLNNQLRSSNSTMKEVLHIPGNYEIMLYALNDSTQCDDSVSYSFTVDPLPNLQLTPDTVVCRGDTARLEAQGGERYIWTPNKYLLSDTGMHVYSIPLSDVTYMVWTEDSNGCVKEDSLLVRVQNRPVLTYIDSGFTIFQGEEVQITALTNMDVLYSWSPSWYLDCNNCPTPWASPRESYDYVLTYQDSFGCFVQDTMVRVEVLDEFAIYFPNAFTPNNDDLNESYQPKIFGIKEVMHFQIYDRWGMLVFETTELNTGWNGKINEEISNHNTIYSYRYKAKRFNDKIVQKIGSFTLISP